MAVEGILSERDIVRELGRRGAACMADTVDGVMTRDVFGCTPNDDADIVLQTMYGQTVSPFACHVEDGKYDRADFPLAMCSLRACPELQLEKDALTGMIAGYCAKGLRFAVSQYCCVTQNRETRNAHWIYTPEPFTR